MHSRSEPPDVQLERCSVEPEPLHDHTEPLRDHTGSSLGFLVLLESAEVLYKTPDTYAPERERCSAWNDPAVGVRWSAGDGKPTLT